MKSAAAAIKSPITPKERHRLGQQLRSDVAREIHAKWKPGARRESPIALIAASMKGRLPALVKLKYERMTNSPFGFFRGAVPVMAADLAVMPRTGIVNQICGDAHVRNLGAYAAPDGRLVFDINDFDETIRAPFEWDLKRLAASLVLAGREAGAKDSACEEAVLVCIASYRKLMLCLADLPVIELAHYQVHRLLQVAPVSQALQKAQRQTPQASLKLLTEKTKKGTARRFKDERPLLWRLNSAKAQQVLAALSAYAETLLPERRHFLALVYLEGNGNRDPLFLQVKEEVRSGYARYFRDPLASRHQGQRVADGQRAMQFQSDPFLGWTTIDRRNYLVRQLNDHKASIDLAELKGDGLNEYARLCGELIARGHARSGDAQMLSGYIGKSGKLDEALASFAHEYADQTEKDWKALVVARKHRSQPAL